MHLLFIPSIQSQNWPHLKAQILVLLILYACVFLSVLIDLFFGIKRAKQQNIIRTSYGYRRTVTKLTSYFGLMLMLSIADIVASIILNMPYFTVTGALGIIIIEAKSVYENIKQQNKNIEQIPKTLQKLFQNKSEIQTLITFLNSQTPNKNNPNNENNPNDESTPNKE